MSASSGGVFRTFAKYWGLLLSVFVMLNPGTALPQSRDLPEEFRALAVLCSSGASVKFQGDIEGGINRLFGKIVAGSGKLDISESETEFLSSFNNETLKVEARKVYNDCILGALQIVYNFRDEKGTEPENPVRLLVPGEIATIQVGQRFALADDGTALLAEGGMIAARQYGSSNEVSVTLSNIGSKNRRVLDVGEYAVVPGNGCVVTLYNRQGTSNDVKVRRSSPRVAAQHIYSFLYQCPN